MPITSYGTVPSFRWSESLTLQGPSSASGVFRSQALRVGENLRAIMPQHVSLSPHSGPLDHPRADQQHRRRPLEHELDFIESEEHIPSHHVSLQDRLRRGLRGRCSGGWHCRCEARVDAVRRARCFHDPRRNQIHYCSQWVTPDIHVLHCSYLQPADRICSPPAEAQPVLKPDEFQNFELIQRTDISHNVAM